MKKTVLLLLMVMCVVCAAAGQAEEMLPAFGSLTGLDDFLAGVDDKNPIVAVSFSHGYGFSEAAFSSASPEKISRVVSVLKGLKITGVTDMDVTDWYPYLSLRTADGASLSMRFNGEWLEIGRTHYQLQGIADFNNEMDRLIRETMESRRTLWVNGTPFDLQDITLHDFESVGFKAELHPEAGEAYLTHPDHHGGMVVGITDNNPDTPLRCVNMAFAEDLPVVWCGGNPYSGLEYWENELYGLLYEMPEDTEEDASSLRWLSADFYFDSGFSIQFESKGDAPALMLIRK